MINCQLVSSIDLNDFHVVFVRLFTCVHQIIYMWFVKRTTLIVVVLYSSPLFIIIRGGVWDISTASVWWSESPKPKTRPCECDTDPGVKVQSAVCCRDYGGWSLGHGKSSRSPSFWSNTKTFCCCCCCCCCCSCCCSHWTEFVRIVLFLLSFALKFLVMICEYARALWSYY